MHTLHCAPIMGLKNKGILSHAWKWWGETVISHFSDFYEISRCNKGSILLSHVALETFELSGGYGLGILMTNALLLCQ